MRGVVDSSVWVLIPLDVERHIVDNEGSNGNYKTLFLRDSWFGSKRICLEVEKTGHHSCFIIKQGNTRNPKKFLDTMNNFPEGMWIVVVVEDGATETDFICTRYKLNKMKVLTFIFIKGAGPALESQP